MFFLSRISSNTFFRHFLGEIKIWKSVNFWPNVRTNLFGKIPIFGFINFFFLSSRVAFSLFRISSNTFSLYFFDKIKRWRNCQFFYQTYGLTPFGKCQYFDLINFLFLLFLKVFSLSIISSNTFFCHFFGWHKNTEILPIYDQTDVVTPLKRFQFFDFITLSFLLSTKVFFLSRVSSNILCCHYLAEIKISKNLQFLTKTME